MNTGKIPTLSIIMVDGSFRQNFHALDFFLDQTISDELFELIWVEYYDSVNFKLEEKLNQHKNARLIRLCKSDTYHSSYCFNEGIKSSKGDIIVIADADVLVEKNFLEIVHKEHQCDENLVMYIYRYDEPEQRHRTAIDIKHLKEVCKLNNPINYGGCLTVRKKWLYEINGYEQHPAFSSGFHANGYDIYTRLKTLGLKLMWHPDLKLYHPWHPYTLAYSKKYQLQRMISDYRARNLNYLAFRGIASERNQQFPLELKHKIDYRKSSMIHKLMHKLYETVKNRFL